MNGESGPPDPKTLLDALPEALVVLDPRGAAVFASGACREVLGEESGALMGLGFLRRVGGEGSSLLQSALEALAAGDPPRAAVPFLFTTSTGRSLEVEANLGRLSSDDGGPLTVLTVRRISPAAERLGLISRALDQIDEPVVVTDREGTIEYVNGAFERNSGFTRAEAVGRTPRILRSGKHPDTFYRNMWETILAGESYHNRVLNRRKDGSLYYEEKTITPVRDASGMVSHFVATGIDVTARVLAEQRLRAGAERYALSLRGANDGLWDWDFRTGRLHLSERWKSMLGFSSEEVGSAPEDWFGLVHPDDLADLKAQIRAHVDGSRPHFEHEHRMRHRDGGFCWVLTRGLVVRDEEGKAYRMAGSQTDITDRKMAEAQLEHDALHDALTGLPNRALFLDRLELAMARARRDPELSFAVMFLDLDRFKIINDSLGHPAGDQLLMDFSGRIRKSLRASDTVARLGGDEFAVLVERVATEREASPFADRILECLQEPFILQGRQVFTSASIGVALYRERYTRREDMVRDADAAMYRAKGTGRGRYAFFDGGLHTKAMRQLDLDSGLRHAVENAALEVHYQPIVRVAGGSLAGFEALVRWPHPEQGFISPAEFIPLAEETGLIYAIGLFVLRSACSFLKTAQGRLPAGRALTMSVNLSGVQFLRPELLGQIDLVVRRCGVDPRSLKLEITESVLMEHAEFAEDMMAQMKAQNLSLSIDDFGTGYSSMKNLRRYPVDTVKLDQSFVQKMLSDPESLEIVRGSVAMAHRLGLEVVAEGIESAEQRDLLEGMGCDFGQGFLFAKALEPEAALDLVVTGKTW